MATSITHHAIEAGQRLDALQPGHGAGAVVSFTGIVRDNNQGEAVTALFLEHYPGMTERALIALEAEALQKWPLQAVDVVHRVGELHCGDVIVFVAVASAHRQAAFEAASYLMDQLKTHIPLWKRESHQDSVHPVWLVPT